MTITQIKQIGRTNRYHLYVDGKWFGVFLDEILAVYGLKTNQEVDENEFLEIKKENDEKVSFEMAVSYLEKYSVTEKGLIDYLKKKGFSFDVIRKTVDKLNDYGFVDDEKFAKNYFESLSASKGKRAIASKLRAKGVSVEIVEKLLENVDEEDELEQAKTLADKFVKIRQNTTNLQQKCVAHLIYKGYDYSVAQQATRHALANKGDLE